MELISDKIGEESGVPFLFGASGNLDRSRLLLDRTRARQINSFCRVCVHQFPADNRRMHMAGRTAAQWGSFPKGFSLQESLQTAEEAMNAKGFNLVVRNGFVRIGDNASVVLQVSCAPINADSTEIFVSAFSDDSNAAELARNEVRTYILGAANL
jgi:hypothetical protein